MDSDPLIPTDASTVHRVSTGPNSEPSSADASPAIPTGSSRSIAGGAPTTSSPPQTAPSRSGDFAPIHPAEAAEIAEAHTVIRGSSRVDSNSSPAAVRLDQTPASVAKVLLGTRLNHFQLEELIGGGGMGAVFRARDEQLDRIVAIKVIPFVGNDPELQRRFRNEAQSAAKLDHPQIARVFEVGNYEDWHYIVFEYIRGTNIRDLVHSSGVLPIDDAVFYTCQLAEALQHAADRGIVHRDIKPSNVLIGPDDKIKLVDMGLARSDSLELSGDMTASGVTLGTFDYISPEQARDPRVADLRSDIYSLGCTLYFMLTGSPPYPGGTMLQKLLSHGNSPPPDARMLRSDVSEDLVVVINKMLAKAPEHRYATGHDLIADLREVAFRDGLKRSQGIPAVTLAEPNPMIQWLEHHAPWIIATTLLLLSMLWMQLISTASRDDFSVGIPSTATVVREGKPAPLSPRDRDPATNESSPAGRSDRADATATVSRESLDLILNPPNADLASGSTVPLDRASRSSAAIASDDQRSTETAIENGIVAEDVPQGFADPPRFRELSIPVELDTSVNAPGYAPRNGYAKASRSTGPDQPAVVGSGFRLIRVLAAEPSNDQRQNSPADVALVASLADAIGLAKQTGVDRIEIAASFIRSGPVRIEQDGLLITTAPEISECVIEMHHQDSLSIQHLRLFDIGSNRIELEDLHFVWKVPSGQFKGGALMSVQDNRLVRMTDCSLTIVNPAKVDGVYAFDVATTTLPSTTPSRETVSIADIQALPLVAIELNNVVVRGQMTMIHMDQAVELQIQWDNGLLAISERMIDMKGAAIPLNAASGAIQLSLTRLTAWIPQGLVRLRLGVDRPYPIPIDREARSCVFVVDEGTPHVEISGLDSFDNADSLLKLRGEANAYDVDPTLTDPFLLLSDNEGQILITRMDELKMNLLPWSDEKSPRWFVRWASPGFAGSASVAAVDQMTVDDFSQYGTVLSGFNAELLPQIPLRQ